MPILVLVSPFENLFHISAPLKSDFTGCKLAKKLVLAANMSQNDLRQWVLLKISSFGPKEHEKKSWCFCPACPHFIKIWT